MQRIRNRALSEPAMRHYVAVAMLSALLWPALLLAEQLAITFDDLPLNGRLPRGVSELDIVRQTLPILSKRRAPPVFGFMNAAKLENSPQGVAALQVWMARGQRLGSHTYSHLDLTTSSVEDFARDVRHNEPPLALLSPRADWRWFRYPYLREGEALDKRHAVRELLRERQYSIAQTTIDYEDYLWNTPYARCLEQQDAVAIRWLEESYLQVAASYIDASRTMAHAIYGREIRHVLLLHLGAFTPRILPPLLDLLKQRGFELTTLEQAQNDPAYLSDPDFATPYGGTLLEQHMEARRLTFPSVQPKPKETLTAACVSATRG